MASIDYRNYHANFIAGAVATTNSEAKVKAADTISSHHDNGGDHKKPEAGIVVEPTQDS